MRQGFAEYTSLKEKERTKDSFLIHGPLDTFLSEQFSFRLCVSRNAFILA